MTMADRIAVMNQGRIIQIATPPEIYEAPNSRFVAEFIGDINLFGGEVVDVSDSQTIIAMPDGAMIRAERGPTLSKGDKAGFAIRPEKMRVTRERPADAANAFEGEMWDIGYLGDMTVFHVKLTSGQIVKASTLNAARAVSDPFSYDDQLWVSFDADGGVILKEE